MRRGHACETTVRHEYADANRRQISHRLGGGTLMKLDINLLRSYERSSRHMPEYREFDIYDRSKHLTFTNELTSADELVANRIASRVAALRSTQHAFDDFLAGQDNLVGETTSSWQRYQQLPRKTPTEKMVGQIFRILRIVRIATTHAQGHVTAEDGLVHLSCSFNHCALLLSLTEVGMELLMAFVAYYFEAKTLPYSDTYTEWVLDQYFLDIIGEVKRFADEDRVLYQFHHRGFFNRHFRYDCDSPTMVIEGEHCEFDLNKAQSDTKAFPFDFYIIVNQNLHIVPVEALSNDRLHVDKLPLWQARCVDGVSLPASFRGRFTRERMIQGHPMT
jgi:hypothetical protein